MTSTPETGYVTSRDGTRIGYLRQGSGPGLLLVQGAMGTAYSYNDLGRALASDYTVYALDRRGRGLSPKSYDPAHTIERDVEDVDAVLEATGSSRVFGLSSGAMITLEAARTLPRLTRAAVYEPPFYRRGISFDGIRRLNAEIERGDLAGALATSLRTAGSAPAIIRAIPHPIAALMAARVLHANDRTRGPAPKLRDMLPGIRYDFNDVGGMEGRMAEMAEIPVSMLIISGTRSARFLREGASDLAQVIPHVRHVVLDGLDHGSPWNSDQGGAPDAVADALRGFLAE